jgi:hypothetical protein
MIIFSLFLPHAANVSSIWATSASIFFRVCLFCWAFEKKIFKKKKSSDTKLFCLNSSVYRVPGTKGRGWVTYEIQPSQPPRNMQKKGVKEV